MAKLAHSLPWIGAFLLGAIAPAIIVAIVFGSLDTLPLAFGVTLGHAVFLGTPTILVYRAKRWTRFLEACGGGFLIGALPIGILALPMSPTMRTNASVGGVQTMIDGVATAAGWVQYFELLSGLGACGAVGGATFWLILRLCGVLAPDRAASSPSRPRQIRVGAAIAGTAILLTAAIWSIPSLTKDRSCHNMFRDGKTSVGPKVMLDLEIPPSEMPRLVSLLQAFGMQHAMALQSAGGYPSSLDVKWIDLCTEDGFNLTARRMPSGSNGKQNLVLIGIYALRGDTEWAPAGREVMIALDAEWPGKAQVRETQDTHQKLIPMPDALAAFDDGAAAHPGK